MCMSNRTRRENMLLPKDYTKRLDELSMAGTTKEDKVLTHELNKYANAARDAGFLRSDLEFRERFMRGEKGVEIRINRVANGWIVTAGCQTLVFTNPQHFSDELRKWIYDPDRVEKEYADKFSRSPQVSVGGEDAERPRPTNY